MQNGLHLLADGHLDADAFREADGGVGGEHAFGDHAVHVGDDLCEFAAFAEFDADGAVAGEAAGAGEDEIAEASEAGHGFSVAAAGKREASDLRKAASDERGDAVVTEAEAVAYAGGDGDDVLQCAAEFHADDIAVGVDAKARIAESLLHGAREFFVERRRR